jgi:cytosine/adenosine deaminase-related metal-dependent hydrolase
MKYSIVGGNIVTPEFIIHHSSLSIENGKIVKIGQVEDKEDFKIQLNPGSFIFPALINAHDHLLGTYYPRVGSGPYLNWLPWDNDLKSHNIYRERNQISVEDIYLLGSYRNLISGAATVSDLIPHAVNDPLIPKMPVRVIKDYTVEHECSSFDLRWGRGISMEHREAVEKNIPFITHLEEGYDEESTLGVDILGELKALDEHTVLIHGLSFSEKDIDRIAASKANVVWCPTSNYFMYKETTNIKRLLEKGVNVSLGTDSPMSGGLNILEEMQFAFSLYQQLYQEEIDYKTLVKMVTTNPANAFRLKGLGKIEIGSSADLLIIEGGETQNPYKSLVNAWFDNIQLVIKEGAPVYGSNEYLEAFKKSHSHYQLIRLNGKEKILIGKPIDLYKRIWNNISTEKILPFFPIDF